MKWDIVWKILIAIVALVIIHQFIEGLLIALFPPLGIIVLIVVYLAVLAWLFGVIG